MKGDFKSLKEKTKMISLVPTNNSSHHGKCCNYISYIDQLNLYFYSFLRVLWFVPVFKTQISMTLKFRTFIRRRQRRNTGI